MPKQTGLYQIKGKAQGFSYYRQSGVADPIFRTINPAMSDRVKTEEAFANTRKNNNEFKLAHMFSDILYNSITPSWRSMYRRFVMGIMTKRFLEHIKTGTGIWGERIPTQNMGYVMQDVAENFAKNGVYQGEYGNIEPEIINSVDSDKRYTVPALNCNLSIPMQEELVKQGIKGILFSYRYLIISYIDYPQPFWPYFRTDVFEFDASFPNPSTYYVIQPNQIDLSFWMGSTTMRDGALARPLAGILCTLCICPYTIVGGQYNILQKKCTYVTYGIHPELVS